MNEHRHVVPVAECKTCAAIIMRRAPGAPLIADAPAAERFCDCFRVHRSPRLATLAVGRTHRSCEQPIERRARDAPFSSHPYRWNLAGTNRRIRG
jgi:hypothetical protein